MDTNKKVLIYMSESSLRPIGGPEGYLFNLKMGLSKMNVENVAAEYGSTKVVSGH